MTPDNEKTVEVPFAFLERTRAFLRDMDLGTRTDKEKWEHARVLVLIDDALLAAWNEAAS